VPALLTGDPDAIVEAVALEADFPVDGETTWSTTGVAAKNVRCEG